MDPDVQVGDMKEEQVPWKGFEARTRRAWFYTRALEQTVQIMRLSKRAAFHRLHSLVKYPDGGFAVEGGSGRRSAAGCLSLSRRHCASGLPSLHFLVNMLH